MSDILPQLAIVTGAAGGLGAAFVQRLKAEPIRWHIVEVDLRGASGLGPGDNLPGDRSGGQRERFDVADADAWLELRGRLQREWPRLDLLVNNAGICLSAEVGDGDLAAWRRVHEVNYLGALNGCHAMTPWLKASAREAPGDALPRRPRPAVINVASIMGLLATPALGAYCASKAAVIALSEAMYAELRPHGVNVTVAAPGFFSSSLLATGTFADSRQREQAEEFVRSSKIDADGVARDCLRASARGELYAVMGRRARWFWRAKRLAPRTLLKQLAVRYQRMMENEAPVKRPDD